LFGGSTMMYFERRKYRHVKRITFNLLYVYKECLIMNDLALFYLEITNVSYDCRLMFCTTHVR